MDAPPALLLDTYSLFFRAFHALPSMSTHSGEPTSALYGLSALLLKLLRENPGAPLSFALDAPQATFRHRQFEGYKAGRPATPSPLTAQFGRLRDLLDTLAVPTFCCPGFEADDVLATLARVAREQSVTAHIVTGDRDLLQLARGSVRVHFVGRRGKDAVLYDEAAVLARFGVPAEFLPSYVALIGDPSDNLPGVPGIGSATAQKLLAGKRSCQELFADLERIESTRVRATLRAHQDQILETERLARLDDRAPLQESPRHWAAPAPDALRALGGWFEELEFKSLQARLAALIPVLESP